jgi:hypothetical protein
VTHQFGGRLEVENNWTFRGGFEKKFEKKLDYSKIFIVDLIGDLGHQCYFMKSLFKKLS